MLQKASQRDFMETLKRKLKTNDYTFQIPHKEEGKDGEKDFMEKALYSLFKEPKLNDDGTKRDLNVVLKEQL